MGILKRPQFVVVMSNDYIRCLRPFAYCFSKEVGSQYGCTVVRYDIKPNGLPVSMNQFAVGRQADYSWTSGLRKFLHFWRFDLIILLLEDYWLTSVDHKSLNLLWEYMRAHADVDKIDLSGSIRNIKGESFATLEDVNLFEVDKDFQYRGSLQAAIWRTEYLRKQLKQDYTPWEFEKHTSKKGLILGADPAVMEYVNAVAGEGKSPGVFYRKRIPDWMWQELHEKDLL